MFKLLKSKIKEAVSKISKKIEKEAKEKPVEVEPKKEVKKKDIKIKEKKETKTEEKKRFFKKIKEKIFTTKISANQFDTMFWDLELALLENNTSYEVIQKIKNDLKKEILEKEIKRKDVTKIIEESLKKSIEEILTLPKIDLIELIKKSKEPYILLFLGYNGSGKSLSVARVAKFLKDNNLKPVLAAGDTFRAAGATQLEEYGSKINVRVVKHKQGSDSCAVIYDAIKSAKARKYDVVLADTAGRIHSNIDLMNELKKIVNVNKPDLKILVLDALTGSDIVPQAEKFNEAIGIDAIIFTKVDSYEKGGGILSAAYSLNKPILFLGCGQGFSDLKKYDVKEILKKII